MTIEMYRNPPRGTSTRTVGHPCPALRAFIAGTLLAFAGLSHASGAHTGEHAHGVDETPIGKPGQAHKAQRTIDIAMGDDMRYTPSAIRVRKGETVRLRIRNTGQARHEFSLGTQQELLEHLEAMKKYPEMEHDEPGKVTLAPGARGTIIWQFTRPGTVHFACLLPGHYEAGMKGTVTVGRK